MGGVLGVCYLKEKQLKKDNNPLYPLCVILSSSIKWALIFGLTAGIIVHIKNLNFNTREIRNKDG